jgi:hypothetical protein
MGDENQQPFAGAIIVMFVLALFIVGGGIFGYLYMTGKVSMPFLESASSASTQTGESNEAEEDSYDPTTAEGDINDDGNVDYLDSQYIPTHTGCTEGDSCWSDVIDHTITGHNPIYTSDLDLNGDGVIDDSDTEVIMNYSSL